jgi:hypothetical protein
MRGVFKFVLLVLCAWCVSVSSCAACGACDNAAADAVAATAAAEKEAAALRSKVAAVNMAKRNLLEKVRDEKIGDIGYLQNVVSSTLKASLGDKAEIKSITKKIRGKKKQTDEQQPQQTAWWTANRWTESQLFMLYVGTSCVAMAFVFARYLRGDNTAAEKKKEN